MGHEQQNEALPGKRGEPLDHRLGLRRVHGVDPFEQRSDYGVEVDRQQPVHARTNQQSKDRRDESNQESFHWVTLAKDSSMRR